MAIQGLLASSRERGLTALWATVPMQETQEVRVRSLGREDPLQEGMVTHSSILSILAWRIPSPGGGHGNPLQYPCLENSMDRRAGQATIHRVTKSQTRLKRLGTHTFVHGPGVSR